MNALNYDRLVVLFILKKTRTGSTVITRMPLRGKGGFVRSFWLVLMGKEDLLGKSIWSQKVYSWNRYRSLSTS